jgi:ZIP family zinc transporter
MTRMENVWIAFGLTFFAGITTGLGSLFAFFAKRTNYRFLAVATGFSAGVMLFISFVELFPEAGAVLEEVYGETRGQWFNALSFFSGMLFIGLIDLLIPAEGNPHEIHSAAEHAALRTGAPAPEPGSEGSDGHDHQQSPVKLMRLGMFTALAVTIHNFPEGLATFMAALHEPKTGLAIAIAVALHNIPEGISVAVPIYFASGSRRRAIFYSLLSGLAEPLGAAVAYVILLLFLGGQAMPPQVMGVTFSLVAGIMVYVSLDELLPSSHAYGEGHDSILGMVAGMLVMCVSLLLLK